LFRSDRGGVLPGPPRAGAWRPGLRAVPDLTYR